MLSQEIPLGDLLLDPNNYRLQEIAGFSIIPEDRYQLEQVQKTALQRLQKESLRELRQSIIANGFLAIERIVVTPHNNSPGKFLVIEGNRRVAALLSIKEQADAGIDIPQTVLDTLDAVPCIVANEDGAFPYFKQTLMGIRHVGGIRPWGGYQRAKLIGDLRDLHHVEALDIADRLGLSVQEVNRRYRALKALQQMQENDEFGEFASPAMYPIFHEAVSLPIVRTWLGWNSATSTFDNEEERESFYRLITPHTSDEGGRQSDPKISSYSEVRELKNILDKPEAKRYLLDPDKKFIDALAIGRKDEFSKKWRSEVIEAQTALSKIGAIELANFTAEDVNIVQQLNLLSQQVLNIWALTKDGGASSATLNPVPQVEADTDVSDMGEDELIDDDVEA